MGPHWFRIFIIFALFFMVSSYETDTIQTFIVGVDNAMKPCRFTELEEWYSSMLSDQNSNSVSSTQSSFYEIIHVYKTVFQGFSARLTSKQARALQELPEILQVFPSHVYKLQTTHSPEFLGLQTRHGPSALSSVSNYGSNVIIGMFDTGIWPELESFNDRGLDPIPSTWKGECEGGDNFPKTLCNKKLIGVRYLTTNGAKTARDPVGHGTHTASIAAGREVNNASFFGHAKGTAMGMAPKARLAIYKVCSEETCAGTDILAGFDKAVEDGVNVISISLGTTFPIPLAEDVMAIGSFAAMEKGIVVSVAAGNSGPIDSSVCNVAPWAITVGASSLDRKFAADLLLENGTLVNGVSLYTGNPLPKKKYWPLYFPGEENSRCLPDLLEKKLVRGKIVLCNRGGELSVLKGMAIKKAGGVGIIVAASPNYFGEPSEPHIIPGLTINDTSSQLVLDYISSSHNPRATIVLRGTELGVKPAPVVSYFSSRGPNAISDYVMKPDVIAPGDLVLAGWSNATTITGLPGDMRYSEFNIISGTSMSCPHVSGIAALLKGAHTDWSPAMIQSAIMTTAYTIDNSGNPIRERAFNNISTAWNMGAGHIDPEKALDPGLVYDLNSNDYVEFLCASNMSKDEIKAITRKSVNCSRLMQSNPWDLNYPAISVVFKSSDKGKEIVVRRRVTHVSQEMASYSVEVNNLKGVIATVEPQTMVFQSKGEKMSYTIRIVMQDHNNNQAAKEEIVTEFGHLTWTDGKHRVTSPLLVTTYN